MMLVPNIPYACTFFGSGVAHRQRSDLRAGQPESGFVRSKKLLMAKHAGLQLIGLVLAGVTASTIVIAATLVYRFTDIQLADRPPWQAVQTAALDNT
jgi:hypothetical protein